MPDAVYSRRLDALAAVWHQWLEIGRSLRRDEWEAPSRCEGWDVGCLYAHHSRFPLMLSTTPVQDARDEEQRVLTAPEILTGYNVDGGVAETLAESVADGARREAGLMGQDELVDRFDEPAERAIKALQAADPELLIPWPRSGAVTPLREGIRIALLEATVHLLDVLRALNRNPTIPRFALGESAALLAAMVPQIDFIEAATGRSATSPLPLVR
jgi:uncharacterized protein (TIGR03083 family)